MLQLLALAALATAVRERSYQLSQRAELLRLHGVQGQRQNVVLPAAWSGRFEMEKHLGSGGLGEVYRLRVLCEPSPPVAAKFVRREDRLPQQKLRMDAEVEWMRGLKDQDYVISTVGEPDSVDTADGRWIMMPFMNSGSLLDLFMACYEKGSCGGCRSSRGILVEEKPHLCWEEEGHSLSWILALVYQAIQGLETIHSKGFAHLDLKPNNIMVNCEDSRCYASIIDLDTVTRFGQDCAGGTPGYAAPETYDGKASPANDVWSMGMVLYLMLYGTIPPFMDEMAFMWSPENIREQKAYRPEKDSNIPKNPGELDRLVMDMLNPNEASRSSLDDVSARLFSIINSMDASQEVEDMILKTPAARGLHQRFSSCISHYSKPAFERSACRTEPFESTGWYSCGFCIFCNPCCTCGVLRDGRLEEEHFFAQSCQ